MGGSSGRTVGGSRRQARHRFSRVAAVSYRASRVASSPAALGQRCGCASGARAYQFSVSIPPGRSCACCDRLPLEYGTSTKSKLAEAGRAYREQYYNVSAQMLQDTCQRAARGAVA